MTVRHAGFAAVACIGESLVNNVIEAAFQNEAAPISFTLPTPIQVGGSRWSLGTTVSISGNVRVLPPVVTLLKRPDNLVGVRVRFVSELRLEGATAQPADILVELGCSLLVGLSVQVVNDRFQVGVDLSQATISAVDVTVLEGPSLVSAYGAALHSSHVRAALTAALRAIPPHLLRATIDGFPATVRIAPRQMPCGASLFELPRMFEASFSVSRVMPRVLDHQLAIGVDIAGLTLGDPNALETLFGVFRQVWIRTDGPEATVDFAPRAVRAGGNIAVSINPSALVALLEGTLSQASHHAFVDCHVALEGFSMSFGTFSPNLMPQYQIEGPTLHVGARYYDAPGRDAQSRLTPGGASVHADVHAPFAVHYQTFDGPTDFLSGRGEYWFIKVYNVDVDLPWWVSFGLVLIGIAVPVLALPVVTILDGILPSLLSNVGARVQRTAQAGINGTVSEFGLAPRRQTLTLPSLPKTPGSLTTNLVSMTGEGVEVYASCSLGSREDSSPDRNLTVTADGTAVRDGAGVACGIVDARPVPCTVKLKDGIVDPQDLSVRVSWEIRRADTGEIVVQQDMPYSSRSLVVLGGGGPSPRRVVIDRTSPALMPVDEFRVVVRVYRPLSGRVKEFGSSRFTVSVMDRFDRHHPYVHWNGWAAGVPKESALHRTAVPGRCSMLMRAATRAKFLYLDELPFPLGDINAHREELCEYCFFGGPDKFVPLI